MIDLLEHIDCHSHSAYSGHGSGSIEEMVARADELGLSTYAQTEHLVLPDGMDPEFESSMSHTTMRRYIDDVLDMREKLASAGSHMDLILGIEADWLPGRTEELIELCKPFEYVLGSVHFIDGLPVDMSDSPLWESHGIDGTWKSYFDAWLDMAAHSGPITTFSHPDLPKKYGWYPSFDVRPYYHEMAQATARSGCMVEVNTAGLRKAVHELYPSLELLQSFFDAGVDCTIGCDAHAPQDIGAGFDDAVELMRLAGYDRIAVPMADGDRRYVQIV